MSGLVGSSSVQNKTTMAKSVISTETHRNETHKIEKGKLGIRCYFSENL